MIPIFTSKWSGAVAIAATLTALGALSSTVAAATFVDDRSALDGNDFIDWSSLGRVLEPFNPDFADFLPNSFAATSEQGLGAWVLMLISLLSRPH